jgi:addiction module RelE/StbE family toxin
MLIRWTRAADADLQQINDYLKEHHPQYRQATLRKLYETIKGLKNSPLRGKPGRVEGTREILFPPLPYVAVYRVRPDAIEVLRIWHTARDRS